MVIGNTEAGDADASGVLSFTAVLGKAMFLDRVSALF
jgi:hypothetical protein